MRAAEVLRRIPRLKERRLQYWGDKGYIKYEPIMEGDVSRRDYPESETPFIERMVKLTEMGISPKKACQKARAELLQRK